MLYKAKELLHRSMYMMESVHVHARSDVHICSSYSSSLLPFNLEKGVRDQLSQDNVPLEGLECLKVGRLSTLPPRHCVST